MAAPSLFPDLEPRERVAESYLDPIAYTAEECVALANTDKAVLVRGPDVPGGKAWIPYACLEPDSEVRYRGDQGSVLITHDFAASNGWLDYLRDVP